MPIVPSKTGALKTLQAGRGVAALLVVLFHLNGAVFGRPKYLPQKFWQGFSFGHAGVAYFFVLSGFIIFYIHASDVGVPHRLTDFVRKRFIRIYPVYWIVLALTLPVYLLAPSLGTGNELHWPNLLTDIGLLPTKYMPSLIVAWTLKHEVLFYIVFALMVLSRPLGMLVAAIGLMGSLCFLSGIVPYTLENGASEAPFLSMVFSPLHVLFLIGGLSAWVVQKYTVSLPAFWAAAGSILFVGIGMYECYPMGGHETPVLNTLYGVASAFAIVGFIELERSRRLVVPNILCLVGDASYAIYLVHFPLLSLGAKILFAAHVPSIAPKSLIFSGLFCVAVCAGIIFHLAVEKPLLRKVKVIKSSGWGFFPPRVAAWFRAWR
ncbi:acyltransferase family protein [Paraburkholderia ginsengisoli]|uniref:Acyltransferase n=1 Tax=Paraburkholderia ginsengisoli TaxID=311231 RepID=A0A7T4N644_9BURK|nr:acyltransferase [Paraburkholderia ginsengisoli]QQC65936.1 acyltransferase [Paraburkholderia ginsengisoli]